MAKTGRLSRTRVVFGLHLLVAMRYVGVLTALLVMAGLPAGAKTLSLMAPASAWMTSEGVRAEAAALPEGIPLRSGSKAARFIVTNNGDGQERFPGASIEFPQGQGPNLTKFTALQCWVRVTSDNPNVASKDISIVLYQRGSNKQQFHRHEVPVGRWVRLSDDIREYQRGDISRIVLCMYEQQLGLTDTYTWEVAGLEAVEAVVLDGGTMPVLESPSYGTRPQRFEGKGVALNVAPDAASAELAGKGMGGRRDCYCGFLVRDCAGG